MVPVLKEPEGKTKCVTPPSASEAGPAGGGVPVGPPGKLKDPLAMKGSFQEAGTRGGGKEKSLRDTGRFQLWPCAL